ncbi:hypothetical protein SAMN05216439_1280 [Methanobrevibacter gottschalkii]|uniref:Uncharacterized protein n=1 Tax=Methanobrevibacter gottschalkii TaxID=190974 RepID=A0A1H7J0G4_9EURY|nr:DUF6270 domain-containing protein [Methanobrevibacter gottschalkii]SEK66575.1 hypothetical protein SAMN05216439_1280 [Methanobrevibacter gottschalkii]
MKDKIRVGILGSCATRDLFTTNYNKDYKKYFELIFSYERISLISLFQNPIKFDEEDLKIYPENGNNRFRTKNLKNDFNKSFFKDFEKGVDYLIIDMFFEAIFGVIMLEDIIVTNNTWDLPYVPFYNYITTKEVCNIYNNNEEYFNKWTEYCDKLFDFLKKYPNVTVILNKIKLTDKVIDDDLSYSVNDTLKNIVNKYEKYIKQLEDYIEEKHDVQILENQDTLYTGINSVWNPYVIHYSADNYKKIFLDLCKICGIDEKELFILENEYLKSRLDLDEKIIKGNIKNQHQNSSLKVYTIRDTKLYSWFNEIKKLQNLLNWTKLKRL